MDRRSAALALLAPALASTAAGCGGGGVAKGALVRVYVGAPLCASAQRQLARQDGRAGEVRVAAVCLPKTQAGDRLNLAAIGANARRASEDSATIAYIEAKGPANRFSQTIVESADIAWIDASSGASAIGRVLHAVNEAGSGSLRDEVRETLEAQ